MKNQKLATVKRIRIQNRKMDLKRNIRVIEKFLRVMNRAMNDIPPIPQKDSIRSTFVKICVVARAEARNTK